MISARRDKLQMRWISQMASLVMAIGWLGTAQAGNWPTFAGSAQRLGYDADETVLTPSAVPDLKVHWSINLAGKSDTQVLFIQQVATAKNGTHDEVFQTTIAGKVAAL